MSPLRYGVAAMLVALAAWGTGFALPLEARPSLWVGAALALLVQAACFGGLWVGSRRHARGFLAAWAAGVVVRLSAVLAFGLWGVELLGLRDVPALVGMAGVLFLLLVLEPVGLRRAVGAARA